MAEIIINISACYEDVGWEGSYVCTSTPSEWIKKISDVRNPMSDNNLHAKEAYSVSVNECGTFYNKIVPNKADSRGGFIQVSVIVPKGYRVLHADQVIQVLSQALSALPKENSSLEAFFEKNAEQLNTVKNAIAHLSATVDLIDDYTFAIGSQEMVASSKAAYHVYSDEKELVEWFQYPHQDDHDAYKTIYFISPSIEPGTSAVALSGKKPQKVFTIDNQGELFYLKEGTSFDLPLRSHMDMEPKVYKITADGKNDPNGAYEFSNDKIYMYEGKVNFHRQVILQVLFPVSETKDDNLTVPSLTLMLDKKPIQQLTLVRRSALDKYPQVYETTFDYELNKEGRYSFEIEKSNASYLTFNPQDLKVVDSGNWEIPLSFKKREMKIKLIYNKKALDIQDVTTPQIEVKDINTGNVLKNVQRDSFQTTFICNSETKYSVSLKCQGTPYLMSNEVVEFSIDQETPFVILELRNKPKTLYIRLDPNSQDDDITLITTTRLLNADDKKYFGYDFVRVEDRKLHGDVYDEAYKIKVAPAKFKSLYILMTSVSVILLLSTIVLGFLLYMNKPTSQLDVVAPPISNTTDTMPTSCDKEVADTSNVSNDSLANGQ
ncbi:MAG: hypothetical protein K6E73_00060 [Bacteroidales bacterium]|nr:hypothetical protein [Bacteroidales bacterium]